MTIGRRGFVTTLGGAALAWPRALASLGSRLEGGGGVADEPFWRFVRTQFLIPDDRIYLNNGTLGPPPRIVLEATAEHARRTAATYPPGVAWDDLKSAVAELLAGDPDGFVFPRNTTEAMNFVANGLELGPGDEVLTTDHEHIGGLSPWELVTTRTGATLRTVSLPVPAPSSDSLLDAVLAGLSPATRVLSVSHVTFTTGTELPVATLGQACRERGVVFVVDGAHPPGMMRVNLRAVGPDAYANSPHKWLLAPQGTGLLYLAPRWRTELWPTLASGGWDDLELGAHRLNHLGTFDESRMAGLLAAVEFQKAIGVDRIEARVRALHRRLKHGLAGIRGVGVVSPAAEALSSGMVSFSMEGVDALALQRHLALRANVRTRVIGEYDYGWMRLSTHVYNQPAEIDRVLELISEVATNGLG